MTDSKPVGTSPTEIKKKLLRKWAKGVYYSTSSEIFPLRVPLGTISSTILTERFDAVRRWIDLYKKGDESLYQIEWKEINHRLLGRNSLPVAIVFDGLEKLACFLGKHREFLTFGTLHERLEKEEHRLAEWAEQFPFDLIACSKDLDRLIMLWGWMREHSRPGLYLRQIDLPGIDTKFTEKYKRILSTWLDLTTPENIVNNDYSGVKQFELRYGYKRKPEQVRMRFLDPELYWYGCSDITLDGDSFCSLYHNLKNDQPVEPKHVFVVENDITALAFPFVEKGIVLFGRGYHFDHWKKAEWLDRMDLWYWGDLDTHGFCILDQFRELFPQARSFLMDRDTFLSHKESWGRENKPSRGDITRLTEAEKALYDDLRFNRLGENLRLEQEFLRFGLLERFLKEFT